MSILFFLIDLFKSLFFATASYSNNLFPDPLSDEEEAKHLKLMKEGNNDSRNILIEHNLRLVAHIVKKFDHKVGDQDDLISIGTIGLIKGIDTYSGEKSVKLTTYCARCIQNEILMHLLFSSPKGDTISMQMRMATHPETGVMMIVGTISWCLSFILYSSLITSTANQYPDQFIYIGSWVCRLISRIIVTSMILIQLLTI